MNTKLTLSLNSTVIENAKRVLQTNGKSLSSIVEDYFRALIATKTQNREIGPITKGLTGVANLPKNKDERDVITEYLLNKYK